MVLLSTVALLAAAGTRLVAAQTSNDLEGTWSTKSNAVFTGPGFYDPVDELLIEPALPGLSYSFTDDGWWEQAVYQVSANPQDPGCPSGVLLYQHGTYTQLANGSLQLDPIEVDGRQLVSSPCNDSGSATYLRYNQSEFFEKFAIYVDPYHGRWRLDLYQFDGSPLPPLYLSYKPPMMLPTETMNPTAGSAKETSTTEKVRRSLENRSKTTALRHAPDYTSLWWLGVTLVGVGATGWILL